MSSGTSARQDREFIETLINSRLLEEAIEWISRNLEPEQVFSTEDLEKWARESGFVHIDDKS